MTEWNIYLYMGAASTLVLVVKMIMMLTMGADADGMDMDDGDLDIDGSDSFKLISLQSILAFFMGTGWMGLSLRFERMWDQYDSMAGATLFGFLMMYFSAKLLFYTKKLNSPQITIAPTIGTVGKVYTPFTGGTKSTTASDSYSRGTVQLSVGDRNSIINGICEENLTSFTDIRVTEVLASNLVKVEKI